MLKRLLAVAASAVALWCALASCGGGGTTEPLRWKLTVDVPMNFSRKVGNDLKFEQLPSVIGGLEPPPFFLDLGADTVSTASDAVGVLRKMTDQEIMYWVAVTNGTGAALTFYGMLFQASDSAAGMGVMEYYGLIASNDTAGGRVNLFGAGGLRVEPDATVRYDMPEGWGAPLCALVIGSKALSWRWLAKINGSDFGGLGDTADTGGTVDIRLRMRFSGVNGFDSLFTL